IHIQREQYLRARWTLWKALRRLEKVGDGRTKYVASVYEILGDLNLRQRRGAMASDFYARAEEIYREKLPENHPSRVAQTYKQGLSLLAHGDLDGAARAFRRCIERATLTFGDAHPLIAEAHQGLAVAAIHSGDLARARDELEMEAEVLRICF